MYKKLLLLSVSVFAMTSNAATINNMDDVSQSVARYLFKSPHILKSILDVGMYYEDRLSRNQDCTESVSITPLSMGLMTPITYDLKDEYPSKGEWTTRFRLERCHNSSTYNVLLEANGNHPPKVTALYPGESIADPRLFVDALTTAIMSVKAQWPKCEDFYIADTKVISPIVEKSWIEAWTFQGCKQSNVLNVNFTPDANGGTNFAITNSNVK